MNVAVTAGKKQATPMWPIPTRNAPLPISFWAYSDFRQTPDTILKDIQAAHGAIYLDAGTRPFEDEGRAAFATIRPALAHWILP